MRLLAAAALLWLGCAVVSSDTSGGQQANTLTIQVNSPPPADKPEERTTAPGFGHIWVAGYWDYLDGNYVWRPGRWVQGKPDYEYVRARYEMVNQAWVFHRPHWKKRHSTQ
jgi:hypothetical protein